MISYGHLGKRVSDGHLRGLPGLDIEENQSVQATIIVV